MRMYKYIHPEATDSELVEMEEGTGYKAVMEAISLFNREKSFRKQGLSVVPLKYGISFTAAAANKAIAKASLKADGKLYIKTGGVEMGQGLFTKLKQIAALEFGIHTKQIVMVEFDTDLVDKDYSYPGTGASTGTDLNGRAIVGLASKIILENLRPELEKTQEGKELWDFYVSNKYRWSKHKGEDDHWPKVVEYLTNRNKLFEDIKFTYDMSQLGLLKGVDPKTKVGEKTFYYFNYAAAFVHVEVDCLTGEWELLNVNIIYDAGVSINPAIDIGQIEGGFVQGTGYVTCESVDYSKEGKLLTDSTWTYKIPTTTELPRKLTVSMYPEDIDLKAMSRVSGYTEEECLTHIRRRNVDHPADEHKAVAEWIDTFGVQSSKTSGEPPIVLANGVYFAIYDAVRAFRIHHKSASSSDPVGLSCPANTYAILKACHGPA